MKKKNQTPKTKSSGDECVVSQISRQRITDTTLAKVRNRIARMQSILPTHDACDIPMRQIVMQTQNSFSISASSKDVYIHFSINLKEYKL